MSEAPKPKVFKPRAGVSRKSKLEREQFAKEEAERVAARATAAQAALADKLQGTQAKAKPQRERNQRDAPTPGGMGVFGAGTGSGSRTRDRLADGGRSELLEGGESVRPDDKSMIDGGSRGGASGGTGGGGGGGGGGGSGGGGGGGGGSRGIKEEDAAGFDALEEPDQEFNQDIECIHLSSDEEEQRPVTSRRARGVASKEKSARSAVGLRPIRALRIREDEDGTDAPSRTTQKQVKSNQTVQDDVDVEEEEVDGDVMEVDEPSTDDQPHLKQDVPSSPEVGKKRALRKTISKPKEVKVTAETAEEKAEKIRLEEDIKQLQKELLRSPKVKPEPLEATNGEGPEEENEGKMFLFQFPPLIPFLADADVLSKHSDNAAAKDNTDDFVPTSVVPPQETAQTESQLPQTKVEGLLTAAEPLRLPSGRVGKLRIHKSGKVSLDWGGTDMEVRYGTQVDFLQDAILVETPAVPEDGSEKSGLSQVGKTYALGQVRNKMVVIPDWQKLYD